MNNNPLDAGIPLLTEIIAPAELVSFDESLHPAAIVAIDKGDDTQQGAKSTTALSPLDWEKLQLEVYEKVLQKLQVRIDEVIEQRVRDSLADVLQLAVEGIAEQIKLGLHQTLNTVISQAIIEELSEFQKPKI